MARHSQEQRIPVVAPLSSSLYGNAKVDALVCGRGSIDATWTEADFAALAMAALDQAGVDKDDQSKVSLMLSVYGLESEAMFAERDPNTTTRWKRRSR